jgi:hypothetical protein
MDPDGNPVTDDAIDTAAQAGLLSVSAAGNIENDNLRLS